MTEDYRQTYRDSMPTVALLEPQFEGKYASVYSAKGVCHGKLVLKDGNWFVTVGYLIPVSADQRIKLRDNIILEQWKEYHEHIPSTSPLTWWNWYGELQFRDWYTEIETVEAKAYLTLLEAEAIRG